MSKVVNEKGILFLAQAILNLANTVGIPKTLQIVQKSPKVFFDLLSDDHVLGKRGFDSALKWNAENAQDYLKRLKLTKCQSIIIKAMSKTRNNTISLTNLEKILKRKKMTVNNGSMIGGSLAGISKKCVSYNIPPIYTQEQSGNNMFYSIVPEALEFVPMYLN